MDDTGDYVDWVFDERGETIVGATLGTVFAIRRVFDEPVIDFTAGRRAAPSMPPIIPSLTPVSYLGSWFNFKKSKSGDAIDDLCEYSELFSNIATLTVSFKLLDQIDPFPRMQKLRL